MHPEPIADPGNHMSASASTEPPCTPDPLLIMQLYKNRQGITVQMTKSESLVLEDAENNIRDCMKKQALFFINRNRERKNQARLRRLLMSH